MCTGEPRSSASAWAMYGGWIAGGSMAVATTVTTTPGGSPAGASVCEWEWRIAFAPCMELSPGVICQVGMPTVAVGFNIELGDADTRGRHTTPLPRARDATCGLRHEKWLAGRTCNYANCHTLMSQFPTLLLEPRRRALSSCVQRGQARAHGSGACSEAAHVIPTRSAQ